MPVTIYDKNKQKKKLLIYVFILSVFLFLFIVWQFFLQDIIFRPTTKPFYLLVDRATRLEKSIFQVLTDPRLKELEPFEKTPPFQGEVKRENPFFPK